MMPPMSQALPNLPPASETLVQSYGIEFEYKRLLEKFCQRLEAEGLHVKPYVADSWGRFRKFPLARQHEILNNFLVFYKACASVLNEGIRFRETKVFLWRFLREFGLQPDKSAFSFINEEDVIEVYNSEGLQIYRNFKFFEICSYSLEELYSFPFYDLFERNVFITQEIMRFVSSFYQSATREPVLSAIPDHNLKERFSEDQHEFQMHLGYFIPLFDKAGNTVAGITLSRPKIISTKSTRIQYEKEL